MTTPDEVRSTWGNVEGLPSWTQGELFELVENEDLGEALGVPLTNKLVEVPSGQKIIPVGIPVGWDKDSFKQGVAGAFQTYLEFGSLNPDRIARISGLNETSITALLQTEEFNYVMACRGVDTGLTGTLTPQQDFALMVLTDITKKTWSARLREAGISQAVFMAWMQNPTFARRWHELSEKLTSNSELALIQLQQQVGDGNMRAIELALEVSGRHDRMQIANLNVIAVMNRIMEIIARRLSDQPDTLREIAGDFRRLGEEINLNSNILNNSRTIESGIEF